MEQTIKTRELNGILDSHLVLYQGKYYQTREDMQMAPIEVTLLGEGTPKDELDSYLDRLNHIMRDAGALIITDLGC